MPTSFAEKRPFPGFKQFRQEGCITHFVFDAPSGELAVIDPRSDLMEDYRTFIAEQRLQPKWVIDTRLHSHHFSGSHLLAAEYPVEIAMSAKTDSERVTRRLKSGDRLRLGSIELEILETPGVTPDAISVSAPGLVFTGDTVLIGTNARSEATLADAAALWKSQREVLGRLPDETIVFPSHDWNDRLFSTLGTEKRRNPDWVPKNLEEYVQAGKADSPRAEGDVRRRLEYNRSLNPPENQESHFGGSSVHPSHSGEGERIASISVDKVAQKLKEAGPDYCLVDVREPDEYQAGHIPGALNIPLSRLALHLAELSSYRRIYVTCQTGRRSVLAAKTLDYLGIPDVVNISGGLKAWENAGFPVAK